MDTLKQITKYTKWQRKHHFPKPLVFKLKYDNIPNDITAKAHGI